MCSWSKVHPSSSTYTRSVSSSANVVMMATNENFPDGGRITWEGKKGTTTVDLSILRYDESADSFTEILSSPRGSSSSLVGNHNISLLALNIPDDGLEISAVSGGCTSNDRSAIITLEVKYCNLSHFAPIATATNASHCGYNCQKTFTCRDHSSLTFNATCQADATWSQDVAQCGFCNATIFEPAAFQMDNSTLTRINQTKVFYCVCPTDGVQSFVAECQPDLNWNYTASTIPCRAVCNASEVTFASPSNASFMCGVQPFTCKSHLSCAPNMIDLECADDGTWISLENKCIEETCSHGSVADLCQDKCQYGNISEIACGETLNYKCMDDSVASSPFTVVCNASNSFNNSGPLCSSQDVDECTSQSQVCSDAEICINTAGSYHCDCIFGYTKSGSGVCLPIVCGSGIDPVQCNTTSSLSALCTSAGNIFTAITFPSTLAGYSALSDNLCGDNTTNAGIPLGSRACALDGTWATATWLSSCDDGISTVASKPIESEEDRQQVSASLQILTSNPQLVDSESITSTTQAIVKVTSSAANITETTATSVIFTISNVMESPDLDESGQSQQLLIQLDRVASKVMLKNGDPYQAVSRNVSMLVTQSQNTVGGLGMVMFVRPNTSSIGFRSDQFIIRNSPVTSGDRIEGQNVQSSIHIPEKALESSTKASFYVFGNANLFTGNGNSRSSGTPSIAFDVSSMVISAAVENRSISGLPPDSLLTYSIPISYGATEDEPTCVFWSIVLMKWSEEGCNVNESAGYNTLSCTCDHLTNFAALLKPIPGNPKALNVITIVGCVISTCSLLILVMVFLCIRKTRTGTKFPSAFLLLNLSLALLGLNITLLFSEMPFISAPENYDSIASSCIALAIILHFFLLASCAWMNCEGAMLCLVVIKPLYTRAHLRNSRVVMGSVPWGWVMPAIFVGIVALSDINVYEYPYDEQVAVTCWIQQSYVIYLAFIPTAIMIGANLVVYVILSYYLCRNQQSRWGKSWKSTRESQKRKLGVNLSILILLGLTWIFGFFLGGIENETAALVFAHVFTILNSLQGFFLLVLYILRNKETRTTVREEISSIYDKLRLGRSKETGNGRHSSTGLNDSQSNQQVQEKSL